MAKQREQAAEGIILHAMSISEDNPARIGQVAFHIPSESALS